MYDLNSTTIIQKCLDLEFSLPVNTIYNYIVTKLYDGMYQEMIVQDLLQLLCQEKVKIYEFMSVSQKVAENEEREQTLGIRYRIEDCTL